MYPGVVYVLHHPIEPSQRHWEIREGEGMAGGTRNVDGLLAYVGDVPLSYVKPPLRLEWRLLILILA
jgi:hypothetical protein